MTENEESILKFDKVLNWRNADKKYGNEIWSRICNICGKQYAEHTGPGLSLTCPGDSFEKFRNMKKLSKIQLLMIKMGYNILLLIYFIIK